MAFEMFNVSTEMLPNASKHVHFIIETDMTKCDRVQDLPPRDRCLFVQHTEACYEDVRIGNYMYLMYCIIGDRGKVLTVLGVILMCLIVLLCFMIMGIAADQFFVPALAHISQSLGLSETVAGVTLLALGNGSPDLITTFSVINDENDVMFSELIGAALFVTTVVSGTIMSISPFKVYAPHFGRDLLFFLNAVLYIDWRTSVENNILSIYEAAVPLLIYICYLTIVIVDQVMANRAAAKPDSSSADLISKEATRMDVLFRYASNQSTFSGHGPNDKIFKQFLESVNPIDIDEWKSSGYVGKALIVFKVPILFTLKIFIPQIEPESDTLGWSKLLNCSQILTLPTLIFTVAVDPQFRFTLYDFPVGGIVSLVCLVIALAFFLKSRTDESPKFQVVFVVLSVIGTVFVIFVFADEVINLLRTIGAFMNLSMSFLGATALAWGNSIGDLISDIALARNGYVRMGFAGCYGGPMFNILIGFGITVFYKSCVSPDFSVRVRKGYLGENCLLFLLLVQYFTITAMLLTQFTARRSMGVFLIIMYATFFTFALLSELGAIHGFGTNHS